MRFHYFIGLAAALGVAHCKTTDNALDTVLRSQVAQDECVLTAPALSSSRFYAQCATPTADFSALTGDAPSLRAALLAKKIGAVVEPFSTSSALYLAWAGDAHENIELLYASPRFQAFAPSPETARWTVSRAKALVEVLKKNGDGAAERNPALGTLPEFPTVLWVGLWKDNEAFLMGDAYENNWDELLKGALGKMRENLVRKNSGGTLPQLLAAHPLELNVFHRLAWVRNLSATQIDQYFKVGKDSFYLHARQPESKRKEKEKEKSKTKAHQFILPRSALLHHRTRPTQILEDLCRNASLPRDCYLGQGVQFDSFRAWNIVENNGEIILRGPGETFSPPNTAMSGQPAEN